MPLVLLHGIAQETRTQEGLQKLWLDSLAVGMDRARLSLRLDGIHTETPYYGRLLARLSQNDPVLPPGGKVDIDDLRRGSTSAESAGQSIRREVIAELERRAGGRASRTGEDDLNRGKFNDFLGALEAMLPNKAQARFIDLALSQVETYLAIPATREEIQRKAQTALADANGRRTDQDRELVVVAHSLGSVVALEALWQWQGGSVDLLVTIGSPLSIGGVHTRLKKSPPGWPPRLRRWVNVADRDDMVALHGAIDRSNLFERTSEADPSARADVLNILDVKNHMQNHHGIAGYLDDPVVARVIADGIAMRQGHPD
jgi:hypothetical protein